MVLRKQHLRAAGSPEIIIFFLEEVLNFNVRIRLQVIKILYWRNIETPTNFSIPNGFFLRFPSLWKLVLVLINFKTPLQTPEIPAFILRLR